MSTGSTVLQLTVRMFSISSIQMGQQLGKAAATALTDHSPGTISGMDLTGRVLKDEQIVEVARRFEEAQDAIKPVLPVVQTIREMEEERNGIHTVKPYKLNGVLPVRKTNTGPPVNPFKNRGRR